MSPAVRLAKPDAARGEPRRLHFTKANLAAMRAPTGRDRLYVYDDDAPGLAFCVTASGARSFYYYARMAGRPQRVRIGSFPIVTIEAARKRAAQLAGDVATGRDPAAERRAIRGEQTLRQLLNHWLDHYARLHNRRWADAEAMFNRYTKGWGTRQLGTVNRQTVENEHRRIGLKHPYAANRWLALIRTLFNHALRHSWDGANPARGIRPFKERSRERFLGDRDPAELARFLQAVAAEPSDTIRDFVTLCLLTGQRRGNVQAMCWADCGLDGGIWTIPGEVTKNGDPLTIPLSTEAVAVLKRRLAARLGDDPWVFPTPSASGHLAEPKKAWRAILARAGITNLRIHDLRRTHGAIMAAGGASLPMIGRALGHKSTQATTVYARLNLDPVRALVNDVAAVVTNAQPRTKRGRKAVQHGKA